MEKLTVVVASILCILIFAAAIVSVDTYLDIRKIQRELDNLYWAEEHHSAMAGAFIEELEPILQQKLIELTLLVIATASLGTMSFIFLRHKRKIRASTLKGLIGLLLFVSLLTPAVNAEMRRCYDRVEMAIPPGSNLLYISGYLKPQPAEVVDWWVGYHIAVGFIFEDSPEWIAGGYYTHIEIGTVFYIEWLIDGVYDEITVSGVQWGKQYYVQVYKQDCTVQGWGAVIYDKNLNVILEKFCVGLPVDSPFMRAYAGGETVETANYMSASFSELRWRTHDPNEEGYWDGNKFSCQLNEDSPYSITVNIPYYDFSVSGGGEEEGDDDGWGGGGGGGQCPIFSVWNGSEYVEEGLLNIHSELEEDTVVDHPLNTTPAKVNNKYLLRLTEPDLSSLNLTSHSFIDQVKLLAFDTSGEATECVLVGAEHSEDGNVLYELLLSDDVRTDTEPYEYIDLAFIAPIGEIEDFTFVIEGYNWKLWAPSEGWP